jgi:hypothetical protein
MAALVVITLVSVFNRSAAAVTGSVITVSSAILLFPSLGLLRDWLFRHLGLFSAQRYTRDSHKDNPTGFLGHPEIPGGFTELGFNVLSKVNSLWPTFRLVIALYSPNALLETGLRMCLPEKSRDSDPLRRRQCVLCSPFC